MGIITEKGSAHLCRARMLIPLVILLLVSVPVIFADDSTSIDIYWVGDNATVNYIIVSGNDTWTRFNSNGANISGEFHAIDYNDNPGGFDTFETRVKASFSGGGKIELETMIIDTLASSYTKIETDASGYIGWKTTANSTHLLNFNSDNWETGHEIQANGDFEVQHWLFNPDDEGILVKCERNVTGSILINLDKEWVTDTAFESGIEEGCYALGTGDGEFKIEVWADNYLNGSWGYEMPGVPPNELLIGEWIFEMSGPGYTKLDLEYKDGFTMLDFGTEGD